MASTPCTSFSSNFTFSLSYPNLTKCFFPLTLLQGAQIHFSQNRTSTGLHSPFHESLHLFKMLTFSAHIAVRWQLNHIFYIYLFINVALVYLRIFQSIILICLTRGIIVYNKMQVLDLLNLKQNHLCRCKFLRHSARVRERRLQTYFWILVPEPTH